MEIPFRLIAQICKSVRAARGIFAKVFTATAERIPPYSAARIEASALPSRIARLLSRDDRLSSASLARLPLQVNVDMQSTCIRTCLSDARLGKRTLFLCVSLRARLLSRIPGPPCRTPPPSPSTPSGPVIEFSVLAGRNYSSRVKEQICFVTSAPCYQQQFRKMEQTDLLIVTNKIARENTRMYEKYKVFVSLHFVRKHKCFQHKKMEY